MTLQKFHNPHSLSLPPLGEQRQIASILSSLDDKIELNRKMNKTLESIAKAIFKRWFVDFEFPNSNGQPYKSSGGKMIDSELGLIPEGWKVGNLSNLCEITTGKRPETRSDIKDDEFQIPLIGASSVQGYVQEALYFENIIVTGRVGTHGILQRISEPCWPSDNTLVIRSDQLGFIYQTLANINLSKLNRGSTQPLITQGDLKKTKIIIPDQSMLLQYDNISEFDHIININLNQINNLSHLRDLLLPRLMSGKIRVKNE